MNNKATRGKARVIDNSGDDDDVSDSKDTGPADPVDGEYHGPLSDMGDSAHRALMKESVGEQQKDELVDFYLVKSERFMYKE